MSVEVAPSVRPEIVTDGQASRQNHQQIRERGRQQAGATLAKLKTVPRSASAGALKWTPKSRQESSLFKLGI
jgi:hypothetical protein